MDSWRGKRILLVSDAWHPQISGVVTTMQAIVTELEAAGMVVEVIHPNDYDTFPMPTYPDIPLVWRAKGLKKRVLDFAPHYVHLATEGPLGWKVRKICLAQNWPFTTAYHTRFPEYIHERFPIPVSWGYAVMRRFHQPAAKVLVSAPSIFADLEAAGFANQVFWRKGVDLQLFNPQRNLHWDYPRPILLNVGRVAVEKNLPAFLSLDVPGTKVIVGDGPARAELEATYPQAIFLGMKTGEDLAQAFASGDVFVFPSLTDTFGVVMLESIASGVPVAAYPVTGPKDVVQEGVNGALDEDLTQAIERALALDRDRLLASVQDYTWKASAEEFLSHQLEIPQA